MIKTEASKPSRFIKKWWLEYEFPDGKIFRGWINTTANSKTAFPDEIRGRFCAWRDAVGFHGHFVLDGQTEEEAIAKGQYVVSAGVLPKPVPVHCDSLSRASAERILENNTVIEGYQFSRFDARLEECVKPENTYIDSY